MCKAGIKELSSFQKIYTSDMFLFEFQEVFRRTKT